MSIESKKQKLLILHIERLRNIIESPSQIEKGPCDDLIRKMGAMKPLQGEDYINYKRRTDDEILKPMNACLEKTGYTYQEYTMRYGDPLGKQK